MKNKLLLFCLILFSSIVTVHAQEFEILVPNKNFKAETGTGIDTKIRINKEQTDEVYVKMICPEGIEACIQPDTLVGHDSAIVSLWLESEITDEKNYPVYLQSHNKTKNYTDTLTLTLKGGENQYTDNTLALEYRDSALNFLNRLYPEIFQNYGNLKALNWSGFYPYPPFDIVSHYVFLTDNWRINVQWHVMVPPYNWKKIFIFNSVENIGWGIYLNTDNLASEIPCEKNYYFYQDTNIITSFPSCQVKKEAMCYPNPFSFKTQIEFNNPDSDTYLFYLFNASGKLTKQPETLKTDYIDLLKDDLKPGIYFYKIEGETRYQGKLIIL